MTATNYLAFVTYISIGFCFQDTAFRGNPIGLWLRFWAMVLWPFVSIVAISVLINERNKENASVPQ